VTPFELRIILTRDGRGLYLLRATMWPRPSDVMTWVAKRIAHTTRPKPTRIGRWGFLLRFSFALVLLRVAGLLHGLPPGFLHYGFSADTEDEQHNHPWPAVSVPLSVGYVEERSRFRTRIRRKPGRPIWIERETYHRILTAGWFSLFIPFKRRSGPEDESWGFRNPETGDYWNWVEYGRLKTGRLSSWPVR
jgi:hypothetical protein